VLTCYVHGTHAKQVFLILSDGVRISVSGQENCWKKARPYRVVPVSYLLLLVPDCLPACLPACPPVRHLGPEAIKPHQRVNSLFALICTHFCFTWIYVTWRGCLQFTRKPLSSLTSRRYHSQTQFFVHCRLQKSLPRKEKNSSGEDLHLFTYHNSESPTNG
jgi:hypothetical protein